jgi:hypothetical protein
MEIKMEPITWILLAVGLLAGGGAGFGIGRATAKQKDNTPHVIEALTTNTEAMGALTEAAQKPLTIDAETRGSLALDVPAGCLEPEQSLTPACLAAACWRYQQSDAGRSDASSCAELVDDARIQSWVQLCATDENAAPNWECVDKAIEAAREQD